VTRMMAGSGLASSSITSTIETLSVACMLSAAKSLRALCIASYPDEGLLKSSVGYALIPDSKPGRILYHGVEH